MMIFASLFKTFMLYLLLGIVAINVAGCGGGSSSEQTPPPVTVTNPETDPALTPIEENYIEIAAKTGGIVVVKVGDLAQLTGTSSYSRSPELLSYNWSISSKPDSSQTQLQNSTSVSPSFVADVAGSYAVQLIVSAEGISSQRDVAFVLATADGNDISPFHAGLSSDCSQCHIEDFSPIRIKSPSHPATSHLCQTCHTMLGFSIITSLDHQEVFGNCSDCHNNDLAVGKSDFHVDTDFECNECHNTEAFLDRLPDGSFDHSNITGGLCSRCHDGAVATGKTPTPPHPETDSQCIFCHSIETFTTPFVDHTGPAVVGQSCQSCHGVGNVIGKADAIPAHPITTVECNVCHSVISFDLGNTFDHKVIDSISQPCESCHNDVNATGLANTTNHPDITGIDCAACHNTTSFIGAFVDHYSVEVIGKRCDTCHGVSAKGMHASHLTLTTEDCADCHTPGTFTSGTFDHASRDTSSCDTCHNNVISVGKHLEHIPTSEQCSTCHNLTEFTNATFLHNGITTNCMSCHDGTLSIGMSNNHLPTTEDCSVCHNDTSSGGFKNSTFTHAGITDNCASCHDGVIAVDKSVEHIPTQNDCSVCHNDTSIPDGFLNSSFLASFHPDINGGCEGCHNSRFATGKDASLIGHIPTTQDCNVCHTKQGFKPPVFDHTGITGNCVSCHDGTHDATGAIGKSVNHIATTQDCGSCHNTTNISFAPAFVDHSGPDVIGQRCDSCHGVNAIGKNSGHVETTEDCNVCHTPGTFANAIFDHTGIVNNCASCHDGVSATGLSQNHIPVSEDCSACHNPTAFAGAHYDHTGIVSNCVSCHDGLVTIGKNSSHVPTNEDCSVCHEITGFIPATFNHVGIVDNCSSCHNDILAQGKSTNHLPTNQDCGVCHTPTSFVGIGYNHTGIEENCASCHDNTIALGVSLNHIPITLDCHFCHTTATFVGGYFDHQDVSGDCKSCHDGNISTGIPAEGHLTTIEDCVVCHTTGTFSTGTFNHSANYLDQTSCASCHDNVISTGKLVHHLPTNSDCGSCHGTLSFVDAFVDHDSPAVTSVRCDSCHNDLNATGQPSPSQGHLATTEDCAICHTAGTFRSGIFNHSQIYLNQNTCAACHNDVISIAKTVNHIPTTQDCGYCHNTDSFVDTVIDHTDPVVTSVSCHSCHNGTNARGKSITHIATSNLCEACHTPLAFVQVTAVDHQQVFGACSECHNGELSLGKSDFHTPTNVECDACHNTTSFLFLNPDGSYDHSDISTVCTTCHNGAVAIGKTATAEDTPSGTHPVTVSECGNCHTTTSFLSAYPDHSGPDVMGPEISCDSCHGVSAIAEPAGHPVTNVDCDTCHSIVTFSLGGVFNHSLVDASVQSCESCHNETNSINAPAKSSAVPAHSDTTLDCGICHNTDSFLGGFDHTSIIDNCNSCHGDNPTDIPATIRKPAATHLPTTEDCSVCHSMESFSTGTFNHGPSYIDPPALCTDCHNNVITLGKLINHIPTNPDNQNCSDCHNTTNFLETTWGHVGIDTANCALCHNGEIGSGLSVNHVPTTLDCSSCHDTTNFVSFAGITYNHLGIDNSNCAECHNTGIATPKTINHIPSLAECSTCHQSTDTFTVTTFLSSVHQNLSQGCEGCHIDQFLPAVRHVKSASHLPTLQDCYVCHTVVAIIPSIFSHQDISSNCVSCHDGIADHVVVGAIGATISAIHQNTNEDCAACHNTTAFINAYIDHSGPTVVDNRCDTCHNGTDAIGMDAKTNPAHIPTTDDCALCHSAGGAFTPAIFDHQGIVNNCASCHDGNYATGMSDTHVAITLTQDCSNCHNTTAFIGAQYDHTGIVDNCADCHNGITAPGKIPPPGHVPTNGDCADCHQTSGFLPATFDHTGIIDNCSSCHDAGFATPKSGTHVVTSQDCSLCHNTTTFIGAVFDHTDIVNNCVSCHDGNTAKGMIDAVPAHLATNLDCYFCHTTGSFVGGSWTHEPSSAGNCDTCHNNNGGGASGKPGDHLSTTEQCDVCHTTNGWAPSIFSHSANGDYPGDHNNNPGCTVCHGNTISSTIPWPSSQYAPFCAACHESDFDRKGDHIGGENGTVEQNKDCSGGGSGCHRVSDSTFD